jgi:putative ABC transport system permease protein
VGRLVLIWRLVSGDIERRPIQAALLLVMILTTTTTLTLGLSLRKVTDSPFARTRAATHGPDLVAEIVPNAGTGASVTKQFDPLIRAPGVVGTAGPYPVAFTRLTAPGTAVDAQAEGRDFTPAAIDQPALASGTWIRPGGVVVERGFATALGLHAGETVHLNGRAFRVDGIAASTAQCFYPVTTPGMIWLSRGDAGRLATPQQPLGYVLDVKLGDPASADAFANGPASNPFGQSTRNDNISSLNSWQGIERDDFKVVTVDQKVMVIMSSLLAMLALASIAVAVGGRMAEQTRRVGLLKAVGATPLLVAFVLLAENLLLALGAAALGVLGGQLLAPLLTNAGSGLIGTSSTPPVTAANVAEVLAAAVAVASAATIMPAARGARTSTVRALNDPAQPPKRRRRLIRMSSRLPVPLLLGLRLIARRPRRAALTAASLAIAVAMIVAALTLKHFVDIRDQQHAGSLVGTSVIGGRVSHLVFLLSAILGILAAVNAIFTTWATVIDAQRPTALSRALGATPRQVTAGLAAAQLIPGLIAAALGVPAGLLLYQVAGGHLHEGSPPILWLAAVVPGTLIAVALLTALPARIGSRRPVAEVLRSE